MEKSFVAGTTGGQSDGSVQFAQFGGVHPGRKLVMMQKRGFLSECARMTAEIRHNDDFRKQTEKRLQKRAEML